MVERLDKLQSLLRKQQTSVQQSMVGKTVNVLFEKKGREAGQMIGKSEYLHAVFAEAPETVLKVGLPQRFNKTAALKSTA